MNKRGFWVAMAPIVLLFALVIGSQLTELDPLFVPPKPKTTPSRPDHPPPTATPRRKADPETQWAIEQAVKQLLAVRNKDARTQIELKAPSRQTDWKPPYPEYMPFNEISHFGAVRSVEIGRASVSLDYASVRFIIAGDRTFGNAIRSGRTRFVASLVREDGVWYIDECRQTWGFDDSAVEKKWLDFEEPLAKPASSGNKEQPSPSRPTSSTDKRNKSV